MFFLRVSSTSGKTHTHTHTERHTDADTDTDTRTVGKGEFARNEQFLLFPQCFLSVWKPVYIFHQILNCRLQSVSVWKSLKCAA